ncbi:DUF1661 domain-containing protein [Porphyromonas gulae]|uniref:DUF1661 domain-containing protein n=1 Tax=Porphyromonas gulae TaxID=111105 RepID=UPI0009B86BD4|nr:DUF1661 domain-containing protein [Porphyromonas gulae]
MWCVSFLLLAREVKNSRLTAKKFSRRFFGKHAPQLEHFRFVLAKASFADETLAAPCRTYLI